MKFEVEFLVRMGDFLDGIDNVVERNCAGFNLVDKNRWQSIRGDSAKMTKCLKKYVNTQLVPQFGTEAGEAIQQFEEKFKKDLQEREFKIEKLFEKIEDVPVDPKTTSAEDGIKMIVSKRAKNLVVVRRIPNQPGKFEFRFSYSSDLNKLFNNKAGQLSGIVECNIKTWGRETMDLNLVLEALEKIKVLLPSWIIITENLDAIKAEHDKVLAEVTAPIPGVVEALSPPYTLFPFQNEFVRFLEKCQGNALIGAEMGLGKTLISLSWLALHGKKALVVCPKVVKRNWVVEAQKFYPGYFKNAVELSAKVTNLSALFGEVQLASINFQSFHKIIPLIEQGLFDTLIIDESHNIKSQKAAITSEIHSVAHFFKHKILLSGTAIKNKKEELYTQIELIKPGMFKNAYDLKFATIGKTWHDIQQFYKTKSKHEVLKDLPDKLISVIESEVKHCPDMVDEKLKIEECSRLKADIAIAKSSATIAFVEELLESSDACVLVFTDSVEASDKIAEHFGEAAWQHKASDKDDLRQMMKDDFDLSKNKEWSGKRVFVTTRQSCKEGATLTRASCVVFNDLPWTPADIRQAEDRAHRIGQKNNVNVYWMKAKGNRFDSKIIGILKRKYDISRKILEGKQVTEKEIEFMEKAIDFKAFSEPLAE